MSGLPRWARGSACLVFSFCGCGPQALAVDDGCADLAPGDLVVTEIHANPDGSDGDREFIELFNASGAPVSLAGMSIRASRADGASQKSHRLREGSVAPGGYFVIGNASGATKPEHVDYSYGDALGSLRNSEGSIAVWCGERLVDRVAYDRTHDGRSQELDGALAPDHEVNDDPNAWCPTPEGAGAFGNGSFGTPGRHNNPCAAAPPFETCLDDGSARALRTLHAEDVRISEWMANPDGVDSDFEWVEVTFDANADLNGLQLGPSTDDLEVVVERDPCFPVDAGARVVFGASPAAAPRVDAELGFTLRNSGSRSILAAVDGVVLDSVSYVETAEGVAWQVDEEATLCLSDDSIEYAPGNFGTPGEPNPICPPVLGMGMCLEDGAPRRIVSPPIGKARITEWMADPVAVENRAGEWIEVRFDAAADLNGVTLTDRSGSETSLQSDACLTVEPGTHLVWARELDPRLNGGIDDAFSELSLSLNNRDETITLSVGGQTLDSVTYARSEAGAASQVDRLGVVCAASTPYGDGDLGTPGSPNPRCF